MIATRKSTELYKELVRGITFEGGVPCENAPDVYFMDHRDKMQPEKLRTAKALCDSCPLKRLCLEYALEAGEEQGIWGGMTGRERQRLTSERPLR